LSNQAGYTMKYMTRAIDKALICVFTQ